METCWCNKNMKEALVENIDVYENEGAQFASACFFVGRKALSDTALSQITSEPSSGPGTTVF